MSNPLVDMTGKRIGHLFFQKRAENRTHPSGEIETYWQVKCDCGNVFEICRSNVGRTQHCKDCANIQSGLKHRLPPGMVARNGVLGDYKKGAVQRKLIWALTDEQVFEFLQGYCHYCGISPCTVSSYKDASGGVFTYNGIDRKDNTKGYTLENCVSCCKICNSAKMALPYDEFVSYLRRAGNHQLNQGTMKASIG